MSYGGHLVFQNGRRVIFIVYLLISLVSDWFIDLFCQLAFRPTSTGISLNGVRWWPSWFSKWRPPNTFFAITPVLSEIRL